MSSTEVQLSERLPMLSSTEEVVHANPVAPVETTTVVKKYVDTLLLLHFFFVYTMLLIGIRCLEVLMLTLFLRIIINLFKSFDHYWSNL